MCAHWISHGNFVHRDIRLPNILYIPGSSEGTRYVLIDFEHGLMKNWDGNTLTTKGYYTYSSAGKACRKLW